MAKGFVGRPDQETTDGYSDFVGYSEMPNPLNREARLHFRKNQNEVLEKRLSRESFVSSNYQYRP